MTRDVVVTGVGLVTPLANSAPESWGALQRGESATGRPTKFDPEESRQFPPANAEVVEDFADHPRVSPRKMGGFVRQAVVAADEALRDAELDPDSDSPRPERVGTSIGTCFGGFKELSEGSRTVANGETLSPWVLISGMSNLGAGFVSKTFDAQGPSRSPVTACAAGSQAVADATEDIRRGRADVMIAGGSESGFDEGILAGFGAMRALNMDVDDPRTASRPFDEDRSGFVIGEGAGVLILEAREHAEERGVDALAEVTGYGHTSDAAHPSGPREDAKGLERAIAAALDGAGVDPSDVDHVNAHATSTPAGDEHECKAIDAVFDDPPPVTAVKSMLGHSGGACGAIEAAVCALTLRDGVVPPTVNCDNQDPACDVPLVTERRETDVERVLSNSSGFGGVNVAIVMETP